MNTLPKGAPLAEEAASKYWKNVYGFARTRGLSHQDAEDLVQDIFLILIRRPPDPSVYRHNLWNLVSLVGRRSLNSMWRRQLAQKRASRRSLPLSAGYGLPDPPPLRDTQRSCGVLLEVLKREGHVDLLRLVRRWLNGESYKDIAKALLISEEQVTNSLHRSRVLLKRIISTHGILSEEDLGDLSRLPPQSRRNRRDPVRARRQ